MSMVDTFETVRPPTPLFCHQEFLEKLAEHAKDPIGRRTAFLLQRLSVDARRLYYKPTSGVNRGWRRSRLGGGGGSHFYAWWAPQNALPLKESGEFSDVPDGAIFLRDIRHHDDHSPLTPQSFANCYLPVTVRDIRREEYSPLPWTSPQMRFASSRQPVRLLKGHPGSGKTTALWHAADSVGAERVLYVTYSRDLAALAREYFDRFCSSHKHFQVITFPDLIRQVLGADLPVSSESEYRQRFLRDLTSFARTLGPWANNQSALYDELYAHLIGDALPVTVGRFTGCKHGRVPDSVYKERRIRHLGQAAVTAALEAAARLERLEEGSSFAERYCPELALAWRAVEQVRLAMEGRAAADLNGLHFDCLALDECQDLTPIESLSIIQLASLNNRGRRSPVPLLLAGDEAQTVRPTDFEWAWLSDLLHSQLGALSEFKLSANLRSPRRIAELVNRVWDLYSHIQKQERPSGTGYAEVEEDAADQILYCSAVPGPELSELLQSLATREGLALINLEEGVPEYIPAETQKAVLTTSEAKGLDFHSVCVLNAGRFVERVLREESRMRADSEIDGLRKRLAIDQLRVALSRPTERLIWLDVSPTEATVRQSLAFLNGNQLENAVASCVPAALLKMLEEEELDGEERVMRCQEDARQFLEVKPEMALSRAQQAITLLGRPGAVGAVTDESARDAAYLTLAEVCFSLGYRNVRLSAELGRPDLFVEASRAATSARRYGLSNLLHTIGRIHRTSFDEHLNALVELANLLPHSKKEIEPWLQVYFASKAKTWTEELEAALLNGHNASVLLKLLPPFYEVLDIPDREARTQRLAQRSVQLLLKEKQFAPALAVLRTLPNRQPKLEATCYEGMNDFRNAAEAHMLAGNLKDALQCYRLVPDLDAALKLINQIGDHPAAESLQWIGKLQRVVAARPDKFTKVILPSEKKILQDLLEKALGTTRRKPTPRKTAAKKTSAPRKTAAKKVWAKTTL